MAMTLVAGETIDVNENLLPKLQNNLTSLTDVITSLGSVLFTHDGAYTFRHSWQQSFGHLKIFRSMT